MKSLAPLKSYLIEQLPQMTADKCHLMIVNGKTESGYLEYTARLLFLDYRSDPLEVMACIMVWLRQKHRHLDNSQNEIELSFSSEIIDNDTFDLEIDFPQREKVVFSDTGYFICPDLVWSDAEDKFVPVGTV